MLTSLGSMQDTGCLGLVHWDDPEGWYGEGGGRGVQDGGQVHLWQIHVDVWQNQYYVVTKKKIIIMSSLKWVRLPWWPIDKESAC